MQSKPPDSRDRGDKTLHVICCYPFLDVRFLTEAPLEPCWVDGEYTNVGSLGSITRPFGDGQEAELLLEAALLFAAEYGDRTRDGRPRRRRKPKAAEGVVVADRRLLADPYGEVRVDVTLRVDELGYDTLTALLERVLTVPVYVVRMKHTELISAGFQLARMYLEQSAKTGAALASARALRLLREGEGSPFVVVVREGLPSGPVDGNPLDDPPSIFPAVTFRIMDLAGRVTGVWQAWLGDAAREPCWQPSVRMLCRIICQLSEVTSLLHLKAVPNALAPHALDDSKVDDFLRVRSGQMRRPRQGEWPVAGVQVFANQHLKTSIDETAHSRSNLASLVKLDLAGDLSKTLNRIASAPAPQAPDEARPMQHQDKMQLVDLLAMQALNSDRYFRQLFQQADFNAAFKLQRQSGWSGLPKADALDLVDWAIDKGVNPKDPRFTTLASLLLPTLDGLGLDQATIIVAIILKYRLVLDGRLLEELRLRYQVPIRVPAFAETLREMPGPLGPDVTWHEPPDVELQSWLRREPPDFLDLGYLIEATRQARSVCLVEVGATNGMGTGVLIGRCFVLTNYHVLVPQGSGCAPATHADSVRLHFGTFRNSGAIETFRVDPTDPVPVSSPTDNLDFALLRVEPDVARASNLQAAKPGRDSVPTMMSSLSILQHPYGKAMQLAPSSDAVSYVDPARGILQYITRTASGSSGAPCFDEAWRLVALHHAERSRPFGTIREGILIDAILKEVETRLGVSHADLN